MSEEKEKEKEKYKWSNIEDFLNRPRTDDEILYKELVHKSFIEGLSEKENIQLRECENRLDDEDEKLIKWWANIKSKPTRVK